MKNVGNPDVAVSGGAPLKSADWNDCPHCTFVSSSYGSHLDKLCALHEKISDLGADLMTERQITNGQNDLIMRAVKVLEKAESEWEEAASDEMASQVINAGVEEALAILKPKDA